MKVLITGASSGIGRDLAKEFANREFQLKLGAGQWKKIKFTNIIKPDKTILLKLERTEKHVSYQ